MTSLVPYTNNEEEHGFAFKKDNTNNSYQNPVVVPPDPNNPKNLFVNNYIGGDYIGIFHTHPHPSYGDYPMFSDMDINTLFNLARKGTTAAGQVKNYSEFVLTLTTNDGTFAIKIKDVTKFFSVVNNNSSKIKTEMLKKYRKRLSTDNMNGFKKDFLNLIKELDMGIGLYEANTDFSQWSEVNLDPINANNIPVKSNCN